MAMYSKKLTFEIRAQQDYGISGVLASLEFDDESLETVLLRIGGLLRAAGYAFNGELEIVSDEGDILVDQDAESGYEIVANHDDDLGWSVTARKAKGSTAAKKRKKAREKK